MQYKDKDIYKNIQLIKRLKQIHTNITKSKKLRKK